MTEPLLAELRAWRSYDDAVLAAGCETCGAAPGNLCRQLIPSTFDDGPRQGDPRPPHPGRVETSRVQDKTSRVLEYEPPKLTAFGALEKMDIARLAQIAASILGGSRNPVDRRVADEIKRRFR